MSRREFACLRFLTALCKVNWKLFAPKMELIFNYFNAPILVIVTEMGKTAPVLSVDLDVSLH